MNGKKMNIEPTGRSPIQAVAGLLLATGLILASGCSTQPTTSVSVQTDPYERYDLSALQRESFSVNSPAMLFLPMEAENRLAQRGHSPGFMLGDWEYGRNDVHLGAGRVVAGPIPSETLIIHREETIESGGNIRTIGRRTVYHRSHVNSGG